MKYTPSVDGKLRANRILYLRYTKKEWARFNKMAKALGFDDFTHYAEHHLSHVENALYDQMEEAGIDGTDFE